MISWIIASNYLCPLCIRVLAPNPCHRVYALVSRVSTLLHH